MKKALIFDMDWVLILSEDMNCKIYKDVCTNNWFKLSDISYDNFFAWTKTLEAFSSFLIYKWKKDSLLAKQMVEEFRKVKRDILFNQLTDYIFLRDGTHEMLSNLKKEFKLAIGTSTIKEFTDQIIDALDIRKYFDVIITWEDVTKGKPNPGVYQITAKKLWSINTDCLVFEDAKNGIEAAKNAGMLCIEVKNSWFKKENDSKADYIITNFNEITPKLVNNLFNKKTK